jgi:protease IV
MKPFRMIISLVILSAAAQAQDGFPSYHSMSPFSLASPGALRYGLYGFDNPAMVSQVRDMDVQFSWTDSHGPDGNRSLGGFFVGLPALGFGMIEDKFGDRTVQDYRLTFAAGNRSVAFGASYGWSDGDRDFFQRRDLTSWGLLIRPEEHASLGVFGTVTTDGKRNEIVVDAAFRPFGNEWLTVFADYAKRDGQSLSDGNWSAGAVVEAIPGLRLAGRYLDTKMFTAGVQIGLGHIGGSMQRQFDEDGNREFNSYSVRIGGADRDFLGAISKPKQYITFDLLGNLAYQRFALFDNSRTLTGLLEQIDAAAGDDAVEGIAINISGFAASREMRWEVREKLKDFKTRGKRVVIFMDKADLDLYHFASVADKIVLDPSGMIMLQGFVAGRTFLKQTLAKIGVGFDEWRFFKYKSAMENYSRDGMSEADREQRQRLVDVWYATAKKDITEGRNIMESDFDAIINNEVVFTPSDALARKLVDTLARWDDMSAVLTALKRERASTGAPERLDRFTLPKDNRWSEPKRIAIIYALGVCDMDEGIKARSLVKTVQSAVNDPSIKAIVFRVDSPGGDGMASDIVAEALRKAKGRKPVIVSQGAVAGSGGYWLSMYGDTIVAAPGTISGSIGVIGGWFYNTELKDKLGLTTDMVKAGAHADLGFGFTLPLIGLGLPDRNLTPDERMRMESTIKSFYKEFVQKVADGRGKKFDEIEPLAQGRVWAGIDAKRNGLVDELGGLDLAVKIARERAGIRPDEEVTVLEMPPKGLFDFSKLIPRLFSIDVKEQNPALEDILFRIRHNGQPLPMLPLEMTEGK